jgi:hypothetical protein
VFPAVPSRRHLVVLVFRLKSTSNFGILREKTPFSSVLTAMKPFRSSTLTCDLSFTLGSAFILVFSLLLRVCMAFFCVSVRLDKFIRLIQKGSEHVPRLFLFPSFERSFDLVDMASYLLLLLPSALSVQPSKKSVFMRTDLSRNPFVAEYGSFSPATGEYKRRDAPVLLPNITSCESDERGYWDFGSGTVGQTSTPFNQNQSWFLLAQEVCSKKEVIIRVTSTVLFQGPYPRSPDPADPRPLIVWSRFKLTTPLEHWNIIWDHTCNIMVIAPEFIRGPAGKVVVESDAKTIHAPRPLANQ